MAFFDEEEEGQGGLFSASGAANALKFAMAARTIAKQAKQANDALNAMNHPAGHVPTSPSRRRSHSRRNSRRVSAALGSDKLKMAVHALKFVSKTNTFALFRRSSSAGSFQHSGSIGTAAVADTRTEPHREEGTKRATGCNSLESGMSTSKISFSSTSVVEHSASSAGVYAHAPPPSPQVKMGDDTRNAVFAPTDEGVGVGHTSRIANFRQTSRKRFAGHAPPAPSKQASLPTTADIKIDAAINHAASARKTRAYKKETTLGRIMRTAWKDEGISNNGGSGGGSGGSSSD